MENKKAAICRATALYFFQDHVQSLYVFLCLTFLKFNFWLLLSVIYVYYLLTLAVRGFVFCFLFCSVTPHEKFVWTAAERTYVESLPASSAKTKRLATVQKKLDALQRKAVTDHSPSADDALLKAQLCKVMQMHWKATLQAPGWLQKSACAFSRNRALVRRYNLTYLPSTMLKSMTCGCLFPSGPDSS